MTLNLGWNEAAQGGKHEEARICEDLATAEVQCRVRGSAVEAPSRVHGYMYVGADGSQGHGMVRARCLIGGSLWVRQREWSNQKRVEVPSSRPRHMYFKTNPFRDSPH